MKVREDAQQGDAASSRQIRLWRVLALVAVIVALACAVRAGFWIVDVGLSAIATFRWWVEVLLGLAMLYTAYGYLRVVAIARNARTASLADPDTDLPDD